MEKFLENLYEAEKNLRTVDHMVYVTFPLLKDKRLLLKVIQGIKEIITKCITSILQYEYLYKRVNLYKEPKENLRVFTEKCAPRYKITKRELDLISEVFAFVDKHKESPFEFMKGDKVVILSNGMKPETLSIEKTKEFLILAKDIFKKTKDEMESRL